MKLKAFFLGLFLIGFAFATQAQTKTPKVSKRQVKQQKRIAKGVKSGELTKKEVYRLEKNQKHIQKSKKAAKADGKVTKKERARLHHKQNKSSRRIKRAKTNDKKRN